MEERTKGFDRMEQRWDGKGDEFWDVKKREDQLRKNVG